MTNFLQIVSIIYPNKKSQKDTDEEKIIYETNSPQDFTSKLIGKPISALIHLFDCMMKESQWEPVYWKMIFIVFIPFTYLSL